MKISMHTSTMKRRHWVGLSERQRE